MMVTAAPGLHGNKACHHLRNVAVLAKLFVSLKANDMPADSSSTCGCTTSRLLPTRQQQHGTSMGGLASDGWEIVADMPQQEHVWNCTYATSSCNLAIATGNACIKLLEQQQSMQLQQLPEYAQL
jgi:hypothetical protein